MPWHRHALLRHELRIVDAGSRAILRRPLDLATLAIAIPIALYGARSWLADKPDETRLAQAFAVGGLTAFFALRALRKRVAYHRHDGIMAAGAQTRRERLGLILPLLGAAMAFAFTTLVIIEAKAYPVWLAGSAIGIMAALGWPHVLSCLQRISAHIRRIARVRIPERHAGLAIPMAGAAFGLLCAALPIDLAMRTGAAAAGVALAGVFLAQIDAAVVRYETMLGHGYTRLFRSRLSPFAHFAFWCALASLVSGNAMTAAVVAVLATAILGFSALRIFAYQVFSQPMADWVVTGMVGLGAMLGLTMPPLAVIALVSGIVWLARRAAAQAWLIA